MTDIEQLVDLFDKHELTRLELEQDGTRVVLERQPAPAAVPVAVSAPATPTLIAPAAPAASTSAAAPAPSAPTPQEGTPVVAPLVGVVYRSSSPEQAPFVVEGQAVQQGDTLCLIEAMKMFNEITAPVSGTVRAILFEDGSLAEYGAPLFLIG
ncbi:MAG: acetyl-CoA carboxylase biotin carboxyl carrier protein [Coriobacteriales bacterium]|jgi:acetyl-CoA carboxylase biotin carboxyl carrier protein|nr:acetyl-CoA carboxylase biotin carboxyl carrier protein [Coriobacteriales bacterium]